MTAGSKVNGPAIITEDETTIILSASCTATTLSDGTIDVTVKGA
jgi:N-methylhydantoinase A